ncbi:putative T7SS-secreted protein [Streptomyces sp. NPDC005808]|uniref:putative T7SS-secreted protein n=1 Tax=Streptomyces sp. NPDC005808 TaxID=3364734 RepID=UPI003694F0DD
MARPADWAPLAEADPVPGDPEGIRDEVEHMKKMAEKLRTQAAAMKAIGDSDGLKGKYADTLSEKAGGLSKRLDLAEDRYREVKGHLKGWADDMETAQKKADRALEDAKDAQRVLDSHKPENQGKTGSAEDGSDPADDPAVKRAKEDLETARGKLNTAVSFYDERADHYAGKIRSSIDDDMEDSWWNDLKAWVGDADWLGTLAEVLSNITTLLTFAAIFFPALGVLAGILTGIVFGIHLLMALTGNGSWFDVITDIAAFKMAKNGVKAAKAVKALQKEGRGIAKDVAEQQAKRAARMNRAVGGRGGSGRLGQLRRTADNQRGRAAGVKTRDEAMPEVTRKETYKALGDKRMAEQVKDVERISGRYPDNQRLSEVASEAARQKGVSQAYWGTSTALDLGGRAGDAWSPTYVNAKADMTAPAAGLGSQW